MYYFWLPWVITAAYRLSLVAVSRGCFLVVVHGLLTSAASPVAECGSRLLGFQQLQRVGSVVVAHRLRCLTEGRISVPRITGGSQKVGSQFSVSPALAGRFLTIGPPGKSLFYFFGCTAWHLSFLTSD